MLFCCFFRRITVAIKEGNINDNTEEIIEEAKVMTRVLRYGHIVNFHGISVQGNKICALFEFCSMGDIDNFLRSQNEKFKYSLNCQDYKQVVSWCRQVADAMEFLVANDIIYVCKIAI